MNKKINAVIDQDVSEFETNKKITTKRRNSKKKQPVVLIDKIESLENKISENKTKINKNYELITDRVLSYPEKETPSFSFQLFVVALCLFFYVLGVATSSLYFN